MEVNSGHVIIALSAVHFAFASYAIFFSAFLPLTGIYVRLLVIGSVLKWKSSLFPGSGCTGTRHALQIFCHAGNTNEHLLCHRELGGMAVLPQFVTHLSVRLMIITPLLFTQAPISMQSSSCIISQGCSKVNGANTILQIPGT
jgi:hypothetical protein